MSQERANSIAQDCRYRAVQMQKLAEFVERRCASFSCLCPHDDGSLHLYDEQESHAAFGPDGWEWLRRDDLTNCSHDNFSKQVGGIRVSFWRDSAPHHAFVPMLPIP